MLLADPPRGNDLAGAERQCRPEDLLAELDALGMVAKRAVAEVAEERLGGIEPLVDSKVIIDGAAPFFHGGEGVVVGVGHGRVFRQR